MVRRAPKGGRIIHQVLHGLMPKKDNNACREKGVLPEFRRHLILGGRLIHPNTPTPQHPNTPTTGLIVTTRGLTVTTHKLERTMREQYHGLGVQNLNHIHIHTYMQATYSKQYLVFFYLPSRRGCAAIGHVNKRQQATTSVY